MNAVPSRKRLLDRCGWYEPRRMPTPSTTRQAEILNLAVAGPPGTGRGLILGVDRISGQLVCHDPLTARRDGELSAARVTVVGGQDTGADALVQTWGVLRQLVFAERRVVVLDTTGAYAGIAGALGSPSIDFTAGSKLNPLDPAIPADRPELARLMAGEALGRELTEREGKAVRTALAAAARDRVPVLADLAHHLLNPAADADVTAEELRAWGLDVAFALQSLTGAVDAATTADVRLDHSSGLTHFTLPPDRRTRRILATLVTAWQARQPGEQVTVLTDATLAPGASPAASGHAVIVTCRTPDAALPRETVFLFGQSRQEDAEACAELFELPPRSADLLMRLDRDHCLVKIGDGAPLPVRLLRTPGEQRLISRAPVGSRAQAIGAAYSAC